MAILNIRNLPDDVHRRLRLRAAKAGRSMEAEAREILAAAVKGDREDRPDEDLQGFVNALYGANRPTGVVDDLIQERRRASEHE